MPLLVVAIAGISFLQNASAATFTMLPTSDITSAWPTCSSTCQAMMQYSYVDDGVTTNTADWIGTGLDGPGGEVVEFGLNTPSDVDSATQVVVNATLRSATISSDADTVGISLRVNGSLVSTITTAPLTSTFTNYTATFNGSWTQADVDSMQVHLTRNSLGKGQAAGRDDDVQLANVYATITYTQGVSLEQSMYRWFANQDAASPVTYVKTAGGTGYDNAYSITQMSDGGYVSTGYTDSYGGGGFDLIVSKYNATGTLEWSRTWGGTGNESGYAPVESSDGGIVVTGYTTSYGNGSEDMILIKYSSVGDLLWDRTWGNTGADNGRSLVATSDGGFAVTGYTDSYGSGSADVFLAKFDSVGNLSWSRTWGGTGADVGYSLVQTSDDGYAITGYNLSYGAGNRDMYLAKFDSSGALSWSRTWGGSGIDYGQSVSQTSDGGYILTGQSDSFGASGSDAVLVKFDSAGSLSWARAWGGAANDSGYSAIEAADGGYLMSGYSISYGAGNEDIFLAKFDTSGALTWSRTVGGSGFESSYKVLKTEDGGYMAAGYSDSYGSGSADVILAKFDANGLIDGCTSPQCQSPSATTSTITATVTSPSAGVTSPAVGLVGPVPGTGSPVLNQAVVVTVAPTVPVGSSLANTNSQAVSPGAGEPIRLRMGVHAVSGSADAGTVNLKLQAALRGADNVCDTGFSGESYTDVSQATGAIRYYNNTVAGDGQPIATNANDPVHGIDTVVHQTYEEAGIVPIRTAIPAGQDGLWDFSLTTNNAAPGGVYCLRIVKAEGSLLSSYGVVAELSIPSPSLTQGSYRFYEESNSLQPGAPLGAQDVPVTIQPETPFRLRQLIGVSSGDIPTGESFKLQMAEKLTTCSEATYADIYDSTGGGGAMSTGLQETGTTANDASTGTLTWSNANGAATSGGQTASASVTTNGQKASTNYIRAVGFGFSIPSNAVITGVEADFGKGVTGGLGDTSTARVSLVKNGAIVSTDVSTSTPSWGAVTSYGSPSNLWGTTLTPADVNASDFGVVIAATIIDDSFDLGLAGVTLDSVSLNIHYTFPSSEVIYVDNATVADGSAISVTGSDPLPSSGGIVAQTFNDTGNFSSASSISSGNHGLWDFSLSSSAATLDKTYCLRIVKSNDSPLDTYAYYPEISFGTPTGPPVPTLNQQLRGGQSVINGQKTPLFW